MTQSDEPPRAAVRKADLLALAERVEALTGPDREVDAEIEAARGWPDVQWTGEAPRYTASLDAAASLVPAGWTLDTLHEWDAAHLRARGPWQGMLKRRVRHNYTVRSQCLHAATPALALTAAALRARAEEADDER